MIRSILLPLALLISLGSRSVSGEVPLKAIWALDMNGTRDIYGIDLEEDTKLRGAPAGFEGRREFRENLLRKIQRDLSSKLSDEKARPGFAVASTGLTALNRAKYGIGENNHVPTASFHKGDDLTLVFFSYPSSYHVQIADVTREDKLITVHYRFVPHFTPESTVHLALIPVNELPPGDYRVEMKQLPLEEKFIKAGFEPVDDEHARRIVCQSFDFSVKESAAPDSSTERK